MIINGIFKKLRDRTNQIYYGVDISHENILPFVNYLRVNGIDESFISNKMNRDNGHYHITIINAMYYNKLKTNPEFLNAIDLLLNTDIVFDTFGIGMVETKQKEVQKNAWFIVCENNLLNEKFTPFNIQQDYHVTLAFNPTDVFGIPKNQDSIIHHNDKIFAKQKLKL